MTSHANVLVIGLGPAGSSASAEAARRGASVVGVERKANIGVPVQCAEFIPLPMGRYAQSDGVLAQRIEGMKSFLPSGAHAETDFPGIMIDRARFDQALAEKAAASGARFLVDSRPAAIDFRARQALIETPAGVEEISYDILIAADGPHSAVARLMGLPALETVNTRQYTVPLLKPYKDTDIWLSDAYPGGYAWLFPKGEYANLGLGADKRFTGDLKTPLDALHAQLVSDGIVGASIQYRTGGAIPVGGMRDSLVVGRTLFAGDAAGLTHPITGAGIAAAVVSGERAGLAAAIFCTEGRPWMLADFEEDMRDQFEVTLARACERRRWLGEHWGSADAAHDPMHRKGWIAFPEYFEPNEALLSGEFT